MDRLAGQLGIDYVKANRLEIQQGFDRPSLRIVTKDTKLSMPKAWAVENKLDLNQTIAMGMAPMICPFKRQGIGTFMAKPIAREGRPLIRFKNTISIGSLIFG